MVAGSARTSFCTRAGANGVGSGFNVNIAFGAPLNSIHVAPMISLVLHSCHRASIMARITGVLSPVVTPFNADYSPDGVRFLRQCRWLVANHVGLAVFGTNSEANSLTVGE